MIKVELNEVIDLFNGFAFKSNDYVESSKVLNCRMSNIRPDGSFNILYNPKFLPNDFTIKYENYLLKDGDLIVAMTDLAGDPKILGVPTLVTTNGYNVLLNQRVGKLVLKRPDLLYIPWLRYNLSRKEVQKYYSKFSNGGLQINLGKSDLLSYKIEIPPLATQKAIAEKLDKADALRKKDQELLKQYDELAQSIFIEMFGDPVQNEKGWEKNYLEDLTNLITDGKHGNCNDEKDSGYYFISAKDIFNGKINYSKSRQIPKSEFDEVDRRTNLQINDLVMVNTGATIGKMAVVENEILTRKTTFQKSVAVIKPLHNLINVNFLKYVFELRIDAFANIGSGTAIKNLLLSDMRKFKIISPPLELQNQFAEKIKNIETQKELVKKQAEASENLFQALLQESFSFT